MKKKRGSFDTLTFKNCVRLRNLVKNNAEPAVYRDI